LPSPAANSLYFRISRGQRGNKERTRKAQGKHKESTRKVQGKHKESTRNTQGLNPCTKQTCEFKAKLASKKVRGYAMNRLKEVID